MYCYNKNTDQKPANRKISFVGENGDSVTNNQVQSLETQI